MLTTKAIVLVITEVVAEVAVGAVVVVVVVSIVVAVESKYCLFGQLISRLSFPENSKLIY